MGDQIRFSIPVAYTTVQAPGAWSNGARVQKAVSEKGDGHSVGARATILGSVGPLPMPPGSMKVGHMAYGYFVQWDDMPEAPAFVVGFKLELLEPSS